MLETKVLNAAKKITKESGEITTVNICNIINEDQTNKSLQTRIGFILISNGYVSKQKNYMDGSVRKQKRVYVLNPNHVVTETIKEQVSDTTITEADEDKVDLSALKDLISDDDTEEPIIEEIKPKKVTKPVAKHPVVDDDDGDWELDPPVTDEERNTSIPIDPEYEKMVAKAIAEIENPKPVSKLDPEKSLTIRERLELEGVNTTELIPEDRRKYYESVKKQFKS